jgi:large subunit ribosomal protein L21
MFAIVEMGGKQYKVEEDQIIRVEKISGNVGDRVALDRVLLISDGDSVYTGEEVPASASVEAEVVEQTRGQKIKVFKFKRRKGSRRQKGHRQYITKLKINRIEK